MRCASCGVEMPSESAYCSICGARNESMRRCTSCGAELPSESAYCSICGARNESMRRCTSCGAELPSESAYCSKCGARNERRVRYSLWRVGILTFLSFGLYYFYWMYVSWKHLAAEMPEKEFHPVWHALSQFVPIYNWVVLYQHFRTIKEVQKRVWVESNLSPGLVVVLSIVLPFILWIGTLILAGIQLILTETLAFGLVDVLWGVSLSLMIIGASAGTWIILVLWGQRNLNKYWERLGAPTVQSAGTGQGEIVITAVGGLATMGIISSVMYAVGVLWQISSVYEADSLTSIEVGSERRGSIDNSLFKLEVDAYRFTVWEGTRYVIAVDPISTWAGSYHSDPLESAIVALWDSDGTTVLYEENGATPIMIRWTESSSGTRYVTIESDEIALGNYVLHVLRIAER